MIEPTTGTIASSLAAKKLLAIIGLKKGASFLPFFLLGPIAAMKEDPVGATKIGIAWTIAAGLIIALFYVLKLQAQPLVQSISNLQTSQTSIHIQVRELDTRLRSVEKSTSGLNYTELITNIAILRSQLSSIDSKIEDNRKQYLAEYNRLWNLLQNHDASKGMRSMSGN